MREVVTMWKYTKMVVLTALTASVFAAVLIPMKGIPIIPGSTELRPAAVIPVVFGILFGPAGAWGSAFGNLIGDIGNRDNTLKLWDTASGQLLKTLSGHIGKVKTVAFSPDGRTIVSSSADKTLKLWDAASGRELQTLKGHSDEVVSVAFSPDGRTIISGSSAGPNPRS